MQYKWYEKFVKNAIHNNRHTFTKLISNVLDVYTNQQLKIFQNCLGIVSKLCQGKGYGHFLILNASAAT